MESFSPDIVLVGKTAALLVDGASGPALLINKDPNNTIYLGDTNGVSYVKRNTASIDPLGTLGVDGTTPIWGICSDSLTAVCQVIPGGTSSTASPSIIASQIFNSGLILVDNPKQLDSVQGTINIPAAGSVSRPVLLVSAYQSWAIQVVNQSGSPNCLGVQFSWSTDIAQTQGLVTEYWAFDFAGVGVGTGTYGGTGPHRGQYLTMTFFNYDATVKKFTYSLVGSNRTVTRSSIRAANLSIGFETSGLDTDDYLLMDQQNLASNGNGTEVPIQLFNGPVTLITNVSSTVAGNVLIQLRPQPGTALTFGTQRLIVNTAANAETNLVQQLYLPKRGMRYIPFNKIAAIANVTTQIIANGATP